MIMDTKFKAGLQQKQKEIQKQLDHFTQQKSAIEILLADYGTVEVTVVETPVSPKPKRQQTLNLPSIKPIDAILELINKNPGKWFSSGEMGDYLKEIRNSKERTLQSNMSEKKLNTDALRLCKVLIDKGLLKSSKIENRYLFALNRPDIQ